MLHNGFERRRLPASRGATEPRSEFRKPLRPASLCHLFVHSYHLLCPFEDPFSEDTLSGIQAIQHVVTEHHLLVEASSALLLMGTGAFLELPPHILPGHPRIFFEIDCLACLGGGFPFRGSIPTILVHPLLDSTERLHLAGDFLLVSHIIFVVTRVLVLVEHPPWDSTRLLLGPASATCSPVTIVLLVKHLALPLLLLSPIDFLQVTLVQHLQDMGGGGSLWILSCLIVAFLRDAVVPTPLPRILPVIVIARPSVLACSLVVACSLIARRFVLACSLVVACSLVFVACWACPYGSKTAIVLLGQCATMCT